MHDTFCNFQSSLFENNLHLISSSHMKLILLTAPDFFIEEHSILQALFDEGLELVHLRKPNAEPVLCERLLSLIPDNYRKNIVTHDHFYLQNEYELHGIHLNERNPEPPKDYKGAISCTCPTIEDVLAHKKAMDYVFLPSIYTTPERDAFAAPYSASMLKEQIKKKNIDKKVFAFGNMEIETIEQLRDLGFHGAVINQAIWSRFNIHTTQDFKDLINYFRKLRKASN